LCARKMACKRLGVQLGKAKSVKRVCACYASEFHEGYGHAYDCNGSTR
jgi:hypothetical protein